MRSPIEIAALWLAGFAFVALTTAASWVYGGVEHWFRVWLAGGLALTLVIAATAVLAMRRPVPVSALVAVLFPLALWLGLAVLQYGGGRLPVESVGTSTAPTTIYPAATRLGMAGVLCAIAATLLGMVLASERSAFHGLLFVCLAAAAAVAFGGIALRLTGDDRIIRGLSVFGDPFARFVNRNNAAAYMATGIAAGMALLRSAMAGRSVEEPPTYLRRGWGSIDRVTVVAVLVVLVSLCLAGVAVSRSRGGAIAAVVTLATGLALFPREGIARRILLLAAPVGLALLLLAWLGLSTSTVERFQTLTLNNALADGRIPHWQDATHAVAARPLFGAGLGTYGYAYQEFSRLPADKWFQHADNQFVEVAVESGAAGSVVLLAALVVSCVLFFREKKRPVERILLASLVTGQAAHAVFDFGIIIPAVTLQAAALWGAAVSRLATDEFRADDASGGWLAKGLFAGIAAAVIAGLAWSVMEYRSAAAVGRYSSLAKRLELADGISPDEVEKAIATLSAGLERRPDDAEGHRLLSQLYFYRYRTVAMDVMREVDATLSEKEAWDATGWMELHRVATGLARSGGVAGVESLRQTEFARDHLEPVHRHLLAAAEASPRLTDIRLPLAALAFLDADGDVGGIDQIETAIRLFPADLHLLRTSGRMAWQAGDAELAARCWRQAFAFGNTGYGPIAADLTRETGAEQAIELTAPDDPSAVLALANGPEVLGNPELRRAFSEKLATMARVLREGPLRDRLETSAAWLEGHSDEALEGFRGLVKADPLNPELRAAFATFHWDNKNLSEAFAELQTAVTLAPDDPELRRLMATWQAEAEKAGQGPGGAVGVRQIRQDRHSQP